MTAQTEQLPIPFPGFDIVPTVAMRAQIQIMWQCSGCGTVVVVPGTIDQKPRISPLSACPSCDNRQWWREEVLPGGSVAGVRLRPGALATVAADALAGVLAAVALHVPDLDHVDHLPWEQRRAIELAVAALEAAS